MDQEVAGVPQDVVQTLRKRFIETVGSDRNGGE
jgi:hypothetical protein